MPKQPFLTGITKKMQYMMKFNPGEIIIIPFPFSDLSGRKKRPALILSVIEDKQRVNLCYVNICPG